MGGPGGEVERRGDGKEGRKDEGNEGRKGRRIIFNMFVAIYIFVGIYQWGLA